MIPFLPYTQEDKKEEPLLPLYEEAYVPLEMPKEDKEDKKSKIIIIELF